MSNNETHTAQYAAWERGYSDALLDVYLYLTGNELALDVDETRFNQIAAMAEQITKTGRLEEIAA